MSLEKEFETLQKELQSLVGEICDKVNCIAPENARISSPAYYRPYYLLENGTYIPLISLLFGSNRIGTLETFYSLGMIGTWRIAKDKELICQYIGALDNDEMLLQHVSLLKNKAVSQISLDKQSFNLLLEFQGNYQLEIKHVKGLVSGFQFGASRLLAPLAGGGSTWQIVNGEIKTSWWIS